MKISAGPFLFYGAVLLLNGALFDKFEMVTGGVMLIATWSSLSLGQKQAEENRS